MNKQHSHGMTFLPRDLPPILIADDNADDQELLIRLLAQAKVANPIFTFRDGHELMAFLGGVCEPDVRPGMRPCLLFLDLHMPRLSGFEVLDALREWPALQSMTTVLLPGAVPQEEVHRVARFGHQTILKFPQAEVFAELVRAASAKFTRSMTVSPFAQN